jgi:YVTN family beta-propeller protein
MRGAINLLAGVAALALVPAGADARDAYVANSNTNTVSVIDTATNTPVSTITVGANPDAVAITPDGARAYVALRSGSVVVIDTRTNTVIGSPIPAGFSPSAIAVTPDGNRVYVANQGITGTVPGNVTVIDTATNTPGPPISVGGAVNINPVAIAITPDGKRVYVACVNSNDIRVIDTASNTMTGSPISTTSGPDGLAFLPDGSRLYVSLSGATNNVRTLDPATNAFVGATLTAGNSPEGFGITADGHRAYVANVNSASVSVIDTPVNAISGSPITVGTSPEQIALTGSRAYVTNEGAASVSVIDTQTNSVVGSPIAAGNGASGIAIPPDQSPKPALKATANGVKTTLKGGGSSDPDGQVASLAWTFGDGKTGQGTTVHHTYARAAVFKVVLTASDGDGCPGFVYTGQTALCAGPSSASDTGSVAIVKLGKLKRNRRAGTAILAVQVPESGRLTLTGRGVKKQRPASIARASKVAHHKGTVRLRIKAKGKARRKLTKTGKVRVKVKISFVGANGDRNTQTRKLKLVKASR